MARIDLAATIEGIDFPKEIWAWLDVVAEVIRVSDFEARKQEQGFIADTPYKKVVVGTIHAHISGLKAIYALLRLELVGQAAGQARLLCEGMITLHYIAAEPDSRASAFLDYATIEAYEAAAGMIEWDSKTADPVPAAAVRALKEEMQAAFDNVKARFTFTDRNMKVRPYSNWANRNLSQMAAIDIRLQRLYELIYRQLSAYVHGSAWSFRHIYAYGPKAYDANIVLADLVQVTLGTLATWEVFVSFCEDQLGWTFGSALIEIREHVHELSRISKVSAAGTDT